MNQQITLQSSYLTDEFLNNFIECALVKPYVTVSSLNSSMGYSRWLGTYTHVTRLFVRGYVARFGRLPSGVHRIYSPTISGSTGNDVTGSDNSCRPSAFPCWSDKSIINIVKFPNIPPHISIKNGRAVLLNKYPYKSDAGCFGKEGYEWNAYAPTKYRSLRFLRQALYWPLQPPVEFLYRLQQHTKISDEAVVYLTRLALSFLKVHQFPPNLVIVRDLITKLPKSRRNSPPARELLQAVEQLDRESRERRIFQQVNYVVQTSYYSRSTSRSGWDNIYVLPGAEKYKEIYTTASREILGDVYILSYSHNEQHFSLADGNAPTF